MKHRPIIFSGGMIRAILSGTKTQTRRALKRDKIYNGFAFDDPRIARACPYGAVGDRLWVRETFWTDLYINCEGVPKIYYVADGNCPRGDYVVKKKPSIFMPRWASRITLEIIDVKVERLQSMNTGDAMSEGIAASYDEESSVETVEGTYSGTPLWCFENLWDSINRDRGYGWESNPWVWVIEFRVVQL